MELSQLKYFKSVAETGKLSAAAEALFISAPALSASISRLENELGTRLFERTNNHPGLNKQFTCRGKERPFLLYLHKKDLWIYICWKRKLFFYRNAYKLVVGIHFSCS